MGAVMEPAALADRRTEHSQEQVTGSRYAPQGMQATLDNLTGEDWSQFFNDYVYGTRPLPLDGTFEYLEH